METILQVEDEKYDSETMKWLLNIGWAASKKAAERDWWAEKLRMRGMDGNILSDATLAGVLALKDVFVR